MKETDTLIIGQGIAGSLVAFILYQQKIPFLIIDPGYANTASRVAAGMFTPVSGKRKVINSMVLQQIPFAISTYKQIETLLKINILHLQDIYEIPVSIQEQNEFIKKLRISDFAKYIFPATEKLSTIKHDFEIFKITNSGWLDCGLFINSFRDWLGTNNLLIKEELNYNELNISENNIRYQNILCKKIIFCEGYHAMNNTFFNNETIVPCKGDVLTIEYKNMFLYNIIKKGNCYLVPLGNNIFKAGSTYNWHNANENLQETNKKEIEDKLDAMLQNKYVVINHQTAIRSTTKNREVIAKQHSVFKNMFMLNGLGAKGVIQGPWWAKYITELSMK